MTTQPTICLVSFFFTQLQHNLDPQLTKNTPLSVRGFKLCPLNTSPIPLFLFHILSRKFHFAFPSRKPQLKQTDQFHKVQSVLAHSPSLHVTCSFPKQEDSLNSVASPWSNDPCLLLHRFVLRQLIFQSVSFFLRTIGNARSGKKLGCCKRSVCCRFQCSDV